MKQNSPEAPVTETQGGHFLQEEVPIEIAAALLRVIDQIQMSQDREIRQQQVPPCIWGSLLHREDDRLPHHLKQCAASWARKYGTSSSTHSGHPV